MRRRTAESRTLDGGEVALTSPLPGFWRTHLRRAAYVRGGDVIGSLEFLGSTIDVVAPEGAHGILHDDAGWRAVGYGEVLIALDPRGGVPSSDASDVAATTRHAKASGLVFTAPLSGRFFAKPGPGKPAFVTAGAEVGEGQTICMLEVMKTFHRVTYGGGGLPPRARVLAILVEDEADVTMGQAILQLEPV
ncbi:MAG TPA: biotin/lipoyl-containing protein [Kofleriaceae bacterium]|nr:biotin/lipoyl-containing protein [Kofleriaceae bacterium]